MSEEHGVSRRESLKSLGTMGAVIALGGVAAAQSPAAPKPAAGAGQSVDVVEVAAGRMAKGHS